MWIQNDLAGQGATSRVTGAYFADREQRLDYDTFQEHIAPHTTSDFAFKGVLRDKASAVWRGMIRVEEGAQKTNAYQENRNLLLSKKAHADSIPGLEILANDVRCTHGATLSQVDREQLFYAMARGLSRQEAERLIVRGFFQDVLDRIELEPVREALGRALEARIPQAVAERQRRVGVRATIMSTSVAGDAIARLALDSAARSLSGMEEIGLFPLGLVLLPTEQVPLHIFEPRYRELIGETLETASRSASSTRTTTACARSEPSRR